MGEAGRVRGAKVRVASHVGDAAAIGVAGVAGLDDRVEVVHVRTRDPIDSDFAAEVLLTIPRDTENLGDLLDHGLRWVHLMGTGINEFPLEKLPAEVTLTNSRGGSAIPISEWVLAMMIGFEKRLPEPWVREAPEHWGTISPELGTLHERKLALIGFGHIGEHIARRALPFGVHVTAMRRSDKPSPIPEVEMVHTLAELLPDADHVVIAAPLTDATRNLVDDEAFALMKPGVHLVNIARGAIIDQDALRRALDGGIVARAALDVTEPEPLPAGHWLYDHPNVRLSPHVSWVMPNALDHLLDGFSTNLRRYLDGEPLHNVIDPTVGY